VLQYVAVGCSVMQCVAVCCRVWQCVAVCGSVWQCVAVCGSVWQCVAVCLQYFAVCCSELGVLQCVVVCRSVSQCLRGYIALNAVKHCDTHISTQCNTQQYTATHCSPLIGAGNVHGAA